MKFFQNYLSGKMTEEFLVGMPINFTSLVIQLDIDSIYETEEEYKNRRLRRPTSIAFQAVKTCKKNMYDIINCLDAFSYVSKIRQEFRKNNGIPLYDWRDTKLEDALVSEKMKSYTPKQYPESWKKLRMLFEAGSYDDSVMIVGLPITDLKDYEKLCNDVIEYLKDVPFQFTGGFAIYAVN